MKNLITLLLLAQTTFAQTNLVSTNLSNLFPATGGSASLSASGIIVGSNSAVIVSVDGSAIFNSTPAPTSNQVWQLTARLQFDGSNQLFTSYNYSTTGQPDEPGFTTVTNFSGSNFLFSVWADTNFDPNLTVGSVSLVASQPVNGTVPQWTWPPSAVTALSNWVQTAVGIPTAVTLDVEYPNDDSVVLLVNGIPIRDIADEIVGYGAPTFFDVLALASAAGLPLKTGDVVAVKDRDNWMGSWSTSQWTATIAWADGTTNVVTGGTDTGGASSTIPAYYDNGFFQVARKQVTNAATLQLQTNAAAIAALQTNAQFTITNFVFTSTSVASTNAPAVAVVGITNGVAYCFVQIPAGAPGAPGAPGTNTISVTNVYTAYNPSNCILTSSRFTITNIATLNFAGTNYIGRFPQVDSYTLHVPNIGGGGLDPGVPEFEQVWLNYTATNWSGTNGWFLPMSSMNTMVYTNVAVAVVGAVGNTGALDIFGMDHPPQAGVYNMIYRQGIGTQMTPTLPTDLVNLQYLQNYVGQYFASPVYKFIDTNSLTHVQIINGSQLLLDVTSMNYYLTVSSIKAVGTNIQMGVALSNYVPGYQFQISTNMLAAGSGFVTSTNFTISTNAGMVIFTTPMLSTYAYYRQLFTQLPMAKFYSPLAADMFIVPSNSWATLYNAATNKLSPGGTALNINSNGSSQLWKIYDSNGVFLVSPQ